MTQPSAAASPAGTHDREDADPARMTFCSRCGELAEDEGRSPRLRRVCAHCGLGVLLKCARGALRGGDAFLIVGADGTIAAVSEAAELLLGAEPAHAGRRVVDLLSSPARDGLLARHVARAASGNQERSELAVGRTEPADAAAHAFKARISPCSSPRAALVVLEPVANERL